MHSNFLTRVSFFFEEINQRMDIHFEDVSICINVLPGTCGIACIHLRIFETHQRHTTHSKTRKYIQIFKHLRLKDSTPASQILRHPNTSFHLQFKSNSAVKCNWMMNAEMLSKTVRQNRTTLRDFTPIRRPALSRSRGASRKLALQ